MVWEDGSLSADERTWVEPCVQSVVDMVGEIWVQFSLCNVVREDFVTKFDDDLVEYKDPFDGLAVVVAFDLKGNDTLSFDEDAGEAVGFGLPTGIVVDNESVDESNGDDVVNSISSINASTCVNWVLAADDEISLDDDVEAEDVVFLIVVVGERFAEGKFCVTSLEGAVLNDAADEATVLILVVDNSVTDIVCSTFSFAVNSFKSIDLYLGVAVEKTFDTELDGTMSSDPVAWETKDAVDPSSVNTKLAKTL